MAHRARKRRAQQHLDPELDRIRMGEVTPLDLAQPTSDNYSRRCMTCGHLILVRAITRCPKCESFLNVWDRKGKLLRNQATLGAVTVTMK
jgi:rubrerythrin